MPVLENNPKFGGVSVRSVPKCYLCGSAGRELYRNRRDQVFQAPGAWDFRQCSNSGCGLIWIDPVPVGEDVAKLYSNYYTHEGAGQAPLSLGRRGLRFLRDCYAARRFGYSDLVPRAYRPLGLLLYLLPLRRAHAEFETMRLAAGAHGRLLEVGCGDGVLLRRLRRLGWKVAGVDTDPSAFASHQDGDGIEFRLGTLDQAGFPPESFDTVVMSHVIEHVHDPVGLLNECRRVLKPGGQIIVATPNAGSWGHRIFRGNWRGLEPPRHFVIFSMENFAECAGRAGFRTVLLQSISRWARDIFLASQRNGKTGGPRAPLWVRLPAYWFQLLESLAEQFSVWSGEEIFFVGQKAGVITSMPLASRAIGAGQSFSTGRVVKANLASARTEQTSRPA